MICSKFTHWESPEVRVRMTPTFYHSPIFDEYDTFANQKHMRCTPTYHSTIFYGTHQHSKAKKINKK